VSCLHDLFSPPRRVVGANYIMRGNAVGLNALPDKNQTDPILGLIVDKLSAYSVGCESLVF
jgi:hypothetical protein